jgi:superfamily II DNA or RNA helicase
MELRPYQRKALVEIREAFAQKNKKVVYCLPTGGGKTFTFCAMIAEAVRKNEFCKIFIFTHRISLIEQAAQSLSRVGIAVDILCQKTDFEKIGVARKYHTDGSKMNSNVMLCMEKSAKNAIKKGFFEKNKPNLVIIDEVHLGNFRDIVSYFDVHTVGFTATPVAAKKDEPLAKYFQKLIVGLTPKELVEDGNLISPRQYYSKKIVKKSALKIKNGEFDEASQNAEFGKREIVNAVKEALKLHPNRTTLIFCASISDCEKTAKEIGAFSYHSEIDAAELENRMKMFKTGEIKVLVTVAILTTGFDFPEIDLIIIKRATLSIALWLQMIGRGTRPAPFKKDLIVYEMCENIHGLWADDRDWEKMFFGQKPKPKKAAGVKECHACHALIAPSAKKCNYCGAVQKEPKKEIAEFEKFAEVGGQAQNDNESRLHKLCVAFSLKGGSPVWMVHQICNFHEKKIAEKCKKSGENKVNYLAEYYSKVRHDIENVRKIQKYSIGWTERMLEIAKKRTEW